MQIRGAGGLGNPDLTAGGAAGKVSLACRYAAEY